MSEYRKPSLDELRKKLTPEQYTCTQEEGTERPFENPYWALKDDGLYVDVVSGEPLFSSLDKYDSGTGWPSFTKPIEDHHLQFKKDSKLGVTRTEVRSQGADSHLGHVFDDGPKEAGGKRFCMNSAALKFIPLSEMKRAGYGKFLFPFAKKKNWEIATLAGGCFWGMEALLEKLPGVIETQAGYTGGALKKATYKDVKTGTTGHAEAVQILFDPAKTTFEAILLEFFRLHDPTTPNQQGGDKGTQYRSAIFFHSADQEKTAKAVKTRVAVSGKWGLDKPIVTEIVAATEFWRAEEDHQKYLQKTPRGYTCHYVRDFKF